MLKVLWPCLALVFSSHSEGLCFSFVSLLLFFLWCFIIFFLLVGISRLWGYPIWSLMESDAIMLLDLSHLSAMCTIKLPYKDKRYPQIV